MNHGILTGKLVGLLPGGSTQNRRPPVQKAGYDIVCDIQQDLEDVLWFRDSSNPKTAIFKVEITNKQICIRLLRLMNEFIRNIVYQINFAYVASEA